MDVRAMAEREIEAAAEKPGGVATLYRFASCYDDLGWDHRESVRCAWVAWLIEERYLPGGSCYPEPSTKYLEPRKGKR